jgi:hypothetical protein
MFRILALGRAASGPTDLRYLLTFFFKVGDQLASIITKLFRVFVEYEYSSESDNFDTDVDGSRCFN